MARYVARVRTPMSPEEAFGFLADFRTFAEWDPNVLSSVQVAGDGPGIGAAYDVTVDNRGREVTLRYEIDDHRPPQRVRIVGRSRRFVSIDVVDIAASGTGAVVTYGATLRLRGPLVIADPLLRRTFRRLGDAASEGLVRALRGEIAS